MTSVQLCTGPIEVAGHEVSRSGIRWLVGDGHRCRAGEFIAYCNVSVRPALPGSGRPFPGEAFDIQAVFAAPVAGIVRRLSGRAGGGFLDRLNVFKWDGETRFAVIEDSEAHRVAAQDNAVMAAPLQFVAGRRMTEIANEHHGLLTGWHNRTRAWWGEGPEATGTLIAMGTCELDAMLRGESAAFQEMFDAAAGPAQVMVMQDEPLILCAPVIVEQIGRNAADVSAIAEDIARSFTDGPHVPQPADWIFIGALLDALGRSPLVEASPILTRGGLAESGPPQALLLSAVAEVPRVARHRRLGYTVACHDHRLAALGPATGHWLRSNFEPRFRTIDDVRGDYEALLDAIARRSGAAVLSVNTIATQPTERIHSYASFDGPLADSAAGVRALELNLMVSDLARSHGLGVVDADALAANLGMLIHIPDRIHASGAMQAAIRAEVLHLLRERRVPGFSATAR